jgi:hypothetical protein
LDGVQKYIDEKEDSIHETKAMSQSNRQQHDDVRQRAEKYSTSIETDIAEMKKCYSTKD